MQHFLQMSLEGKSDDGMKRFSEAVVGANVEPSELTRLVEGGKLNAQTAERVAFIRNIPTRLQV